MIRPLRTFAATVFYSVLASTVLHSLRRGATHGSAGAVVLVAVVLAFPVSNAVAGTYNVAVCQADDSYGVRGFTHFAHRHMMIRRACRPDGPGLRGLFVSNVQRRVRIKRGSKAELTFVAPAGTRITHLSWTGKLRRRDCRYALQMISPGAVGKTVLENVSANRGCPKRRVAQSAALREKHYAIDGAASIVLRVICVGDKRRRWCSGSDSNYIRTDAATVTLADDAPPTVAILQDTPLATGAWVRDKQPLNYTASDNVGVQLARALIGGAEGGLHNRSCILANLEGAFAQPQPCPNGSGQMVVRTHELPAEGTQQLVVEAQDSAGNRAASAPITARIDNTPPGRVDVSVEGGEAWSNRNEWVAVWANPAEGDRAPIAAANYELCAVGKKNCNSSTLSAPDVSRLPLTVPSPGEWTLSLWRADAAGNGEVDNASVPVTLRYDPDPPQLAFEPAGATDPTFVAVRVTDAVSGVAGGEVEIGATGTGVWQTLPSQKDGDRLVTRIDDAALPAGTYVLRARARDLAGNESSTDRRDDGLPMVVTLPLRSATTLRAGFETTIRRPDRRRPEIVLRPSARVGYGDRVRIAGRLITSDGHAIAGAPVQVLTGAGPEQLVETVTTDTGGRFRSVVAGTSSRTLRLAYAGSSLTLPSERVLEMRVPAATTVRVSRRRLRNRQTVVFSGGVRGLPVPAAGKLVEIQVRFTNGWQTFRTTRSDQAGRWSSRYRFQRTRGLQRYRFRIRLPQEGGYPFETGVSRTLMLEVRGT